MFKLKPLDVQKFKEYIQKGFDELSEEDLKELLKGTGSVLESALAAKAKDNESRTT